MPKPFLETVQAAFFEEMARWTQEGRRPALFWRDDDLTRPLPSVQRFIETSNRTRVPIVFAAIPSALTAEAVALVAKSDLCSIAVHGFAHLSHAAPGEPSSEYPALRGIDEVRTELREGRQRIRALAGELAIDMFVPPWGRFDPRYRDLLIEEGYTWVSGEKKLGDLSTPALRQVDCHFITEYAGKPLDPDDILATITHQLIRHRTLASLRDAPIGLMTHHVRYKDDLVAMNDRIIDHLLESGFSPYGQFAASVRSTPSGAEKNKGEGAEKARPREIRPINPWNFDQVFSETLLVDHDASPESAKLLTVVGQVGVQSVLRYTHMRDFVAGLPPGARVLSAGCGRGLSELSLALSMPEVEWVGLDLDPERFRIAEKLAQDAGCANIRFVQADLTSFDPAPLGAFDAIIVSEALIYIEAAERAIQLLSLALAPTGQLLCIEPYLASDADDDQRARLKAHSKSIRGGFSSKALRDVVRPLEIVRTFNCYYREPTAVMKRLWEAMKASDEWSQLDLLFSLARFDLHRGIAASRRQATAVGLIARHPRRRPQASKPGVAGALAGGKSPAAKRFLFIGGAGRSGTTALVRLLNQHPEFALGIERYKTLYSAGVVPITADLFDEDRFFRFVPDETNIQKSAYPQWFQDKYSSAIVRGDKMPSIMRIWKRISNGIPDAKFITIYRDPYDVAASWQKRADDPSDKWTAGSGFRAAVDAMNREMSEAVFYNRKMPHKVMIMDYENIFCTRGYMPRLTKILDLVGVSNHPDFVDAAEQYIGKGPGLARRPERHSHPADLSDYVSRNIDWDLMDEARARAI